MSILDELRAMVAWKFDNGTPNNGDMQKTIADFDAKHPGLIDKTRNCANCGLPMPNYWEDGSGGPQGNPGWGYVWTFAGPKWLDQNEVDDEELHDIWLCCPTCVKKAS